MMNKQCSAIDAFNRDAEANRGYLYTTDSRLSSYLANRRLTDLALEIVDFQGKRVLDLGCGDGSYTFELFDRGKPLNMRGVDLADEAIRIAQGRVNGRNITFEAQNVDLLPYDSDSFDIAHIRGVLHHTDNPFGALREALRVAKTAVVIEPNGYNLILKFLERFSRYHIEHREKSYLPLSLDRWIKQAEGEVCVRRYAGLVPFFCPDWLAKLLKQAEPFIERLPLINRLGCAVYVVLVTRAKRQD